MMDKKSMDRFSDAKLVKSSCIMLLQICDFMGLLRFLVLEHNCGIKKRTFRMVPRCSMLNEVVLNKCGVNGNILHIEPK
jgi:hypothetical protein